MGNTAWAVNKLAEKLQHYYKNVQLISCESECDMMLEVEDSDIIGIAFPTHSSLAPRLCQDFIKALPKSSCKPLIALTTAGYMAGDVLWHSLKSLKEKGYLPQVFCNITIGNNMHLPILSPLRVTRPNKLTKRLNKAEKKIDKMVHTITEGALLIEGIKPLGRLLGVIQRCITRQFKSIAFKGFSSDGNCNGCGWCVKHCPADNIQLDTKGVKILDQCMLCMRCYNYCPNHAIQMTKRTKNNKRYKRYKGPEGKYPS